MTFKKENYTTSLEKAKTLVPGFRQAFSIFEERLVLDRCSKSMFSNYSRNLAHLALHFGRVPHVVFTIPQELNAFCLKYPKELYSILFQSSKETLFAFGNDPKHLGSQLGGISVLHTWGQNLSLDPHVHMIIPGGGFTQENKWKKCASNGDFLFPIRIMAKVYRGKFMEKILHFLNENKTPVQLALRRKLYDKNYLR